MKHKELKVKRLMFGDTLKSAATAIGLKDLTSYGDREKGILPFTLPEVVVLSKRYNLTDEEIIDIFFKD